MMHLDTAALVPMGQETTALAITDEVGFQPACQPMFAARMAKPIGQEDESAIREGRTFLGLAKQGVEDGPQAELVKEGADNQNGSPGGGFEDVDVTVRFTGPRWFALEEALQLGQQDGEEVLTPEIDDGALFDLTVLAKGLDDTDILVDRAIGRRHFDGAEVHGVIVSRRCWRRSRSNNAIYWQNLSSCVTTLFGPDGGSDAKTTVKHGGSRNADITDR
jgi:hypothetical protein